jgi:hypothetical protein
MNILDTIYNKGYQDGRKNAILVYHFDVDAICISSYSNPKYQEYYTKGYNKGFESLDTDPYIEECDINCPINILF